jgi:ribosomal protein S18 acetylase RimI-like enzyme
MSVRLREVRDDELPAVGALHYHSRVAAYRGFLPAEALSFGSPEALGEWWSERFRWERDTHRLTVAVDGDTIVGFTYVGPSEEPETAELYAIHVDPAHVGTGVGRELMVSALAGLAKHGDRAVLWVLDGNDRARRFYEEGGWAADGTIRAAPMGGTETRQLRYSRSLAAEPGGRERVTS